MMTIARGIVYPESILRKRIENFFEFVPENSVSLIMSPPPIPRNQDVDYRYRPSSRVLYLTGIADPEVIVLFRKGRFSNSVSVFRRNIPYEQRVWIGDPTPDSDIKKIADEIFDISVFEEKLEKMLCGTNFFLYPIGEFEKFDETFGRIYSSMKKRSRAGVLPPSRIMDVDFFIGRMRMSKDDYELSIIKKAVAVTKMALREIEDMMKEGFFEYEIDARILSIYRRMGGWEAFPTIVASGKNSVILHYMKNLSPVYVPCIVDTGAEINFYASDITRTFIPDTSDKLRERNTRLILEGVINIQKKVIENVKSGVRFSYLNELSQKLITSFLIDLGILKGAVEENIEKKRFKAFFPHRIGHHLGLDVHDNCPYYDEDGEEIPIPERAVITVEPGVYIPDASYVFISKDGKVFLESDRVNHSGADIAEFEKVEIPSEFRGIGVRWEDDVFVDKNGGHIL